jgi:hypothetical protein
MKSIMDLIRAGTCTLMGVPISISRFKANSWDETGAMGAYQSLLSKLVLDDSMTPEVTEATLLHEIIHAIDQTNGLLLNEQQVSTLATGLYAFLKDNSLIAPAVYIFEEYKVQPALAETLREGTGGKPD